MVGKAPKGWKLSVLVIGAGGSVFDRYHSHEAHLDQQGGNGCYRAFGHGRANAIRNVLHDFKSGDQWGNYRRAGLPVPAQP